MVRSALALLQIAFSTLPAFGQTASSLVTAEDGTAIARDCSGDVLWQQLKSDAGPASALATASPSAAATAAWDPYTTLNPSLQSMVIGPVFDSLGNAWVAVGDTVNLTAMEWDHSTGTWQTPHILGPAGNRVINTVGLAVDQAGGVHFTYNAGSPTGQAPFSVMWAKYSPSTGWQDPALAYSSPGAVGVTLPAIDSTGRLVLVLGGNGEVSSIVYTPATASWGGLQQLGPQRGLEGLPPSVAANKSGTRLALVYLVGRHGMQYTFFNTATGQWNTPDVIPGSKLSTFSAGGTLSFFPIVVDEPGNVTLVTSTYLLGLNGVVGFRYEGGQWTSKPLLLPSKHTAFVDTFGSIAVNTSGEVLMATPTNAGPSVTDIRIFRYKPGGGWASTETAASYASSRIARCKIAWFQ